MRSTFRFSVPFRALLLAGSATLLFACGDTDPDFEPGPDFSGSPLQVKLLFDAENPPNFGEIVFQWSEVDGATHYRVFVDENGDRDNSLDFVQFGGDVAAGTDPLEIAYPVSLHLADWAKARFMLQSCDAGGCTEIGQQDIARLSVAFITPLVGAGYTAAISEQGDRLVAGLPATSVFECEVLIPVPAEDVDEPCEYDQDLPQEEVDELQLFESIPRAGSVSVFSLVDGIWTQEALIRASNIGEGDAFGSDVAISDDGNTIVVAANKEDSSATGVNGDSSNDDEPESGAVYVLTRSVVDDEAVWTETAYLKASNTQGDPTPDNGVLDGDEFGSVVVVSGDGLTVAVSAFGEDSAAMGIDGDGSDNSASNSGAVYVFRNVADVWAQEAYVKASNTDSDDAFGSSLSLSSDGSRLAVGAIRESSAASGINGDPFNNGRQSSGAVYMFDRSGLMWSQQAFIKAQNPDARDEFGFAVGLNGAGDVLVVSAPQEDSAAQVVNGDQTDNPAPDFNTGAGYIFEYSGSAWAQTTFLKANNADPIDELGAAVAINNSGDLVLVTSIREGGVQSGVNPNGDLDSFIASGAGYLYERAGGSWRQKAYIKASNNVSGNLYGWDADFGADGDRLIITSFGNGFQAPTIYLH